MFRKLFLILRKFFEKFQKDILATLHDICGQAWPEIAWLGNFFWFILKFINIQKT